MLKRRFEWTDNSDYGAGWTPTFIKGADPTTGFGAAHDCLEHFPRCIGGFEGEMMAFGAMHFVRSEYPWPRGDIYYNQKGDLANFMRSGLMYGEQTLNDPGSVPTNSDYIDQSTLRKMVRAAVMEILGEEADDRHNRAYYLRKLPPDPVNRIMGWINKGVLKAEKRYAQWGISGWQATDLFMQIEEGFEKRAGSGEFGEYIDVRVDFSRHKVQIDRDYVRGW